MSKKMIACLLAALVLTSCSENTGNADPSVEGTDVAPETTVEVTPAPTQNPTPAATPEPSVSADPIPLDMVGTWNRTWSEAEGSRVETESGVCTIVIEGSSENSLTISYTDNAFPENNYSSKPMKITSGELYNGCGNAVWFAEVDYIGAYDTSFCVTVLEDDILLLQNLFLFDGAPMVSYEWFSRTA